MSNPLIQSVQSSALPAKQVQPSGLSSAERLRLHRKTVEFEAMLLKQFLKLSHGDMARGLFGGGMAEEMFQDFLDEERALSMAENGGFGLAEMLEREILGMPKKDIFQKDLKNLDEAVDNTNRMNNATMARQAYKQP